MGIDIGSKLVVGRSYLRIVEHYRERLDEDSFEEWLEDFEEDLYNGSYDYASPYYDSGPEEWFVGIEVPDGNIDEAIIAIRSAQEDFKSMFGIEGELISSPDVT